MTKCRVFIKETLLSKPKKIFSIEPLHTKKEGNWIRVQNWSTLLGRQLGLSTAASIYNHCTSDGIGSHLTIKHKDSEQPHLNYECHYWYGRNTYNFKLFKGITLIENETLFTRESPILPIMVPGYAPESFDTYMKKKSLSFQFGGMSIPLIGNFGPGDIFKTPPGRDDIVIDASNYPNARMNVSGFISSKNEYRDRDDAKQKTKVLRKENLPEYGVSVMLFANESS